MKKLVILPGNSNKNKAWGEVMSKHYSSSFDATFMQNYDHWLSGEEVINFETEAEKLRDAVQKDSEEDVEYTVFAKSYRSKEAVLDFGFN